MGEKLGLQLYSIKEQTEADFMGALMKVARMGYQGVEFAGWFGLNAKALKRLLQDLGLKSAGSHVGLDKLEGDTMKATIEFCAAVGDPFVVCPYLPEALRSTADDWKRTAARFNAIGEACRDAGMKFCYHNHDYPFHLFEGRTGFDILLAETDPALVGIELDTFWASHQNLDPAAYIAHLGSRCASLHIKDMKSLEERVSTEAGAGVMDIGSVVEAGRRIGIEWFIVEQEEFERPPMESIRMNADYLKPLLQG